MTSYPSMATTTQMLDQMSPSCLLGAINAFEVQQPEVALTKKIALINHYKFSNDEMLYFDLHMNEENHLLFADLLRENYANKSEFGRGFEEGSVIFYNSLDYFLD